MLSLFILAVVLNICVAKIPPASILFEKDTNTDQNISPLFVGKNLASLEDSGPSLHWKDEQYKGKINLGNNGQEFSVTFDSSYTGLWVLSDKCTSDYCSNHHLYKRSSTYTKITDDVNMNYKDGEMTADVGKDSLKIGPLEIEKQKFSMVVKDNGGLPNGEADGVFGLGYQKCSDQTSGDSPFCQMIKDNLLANKVFSLYFTRNKAEILFGDWDDSLIKSGSLSFLPIKGDKDWRIEITLIKGRNDDWIINCLPTCETVIDTSSWSISGPETEINKINQYIGATGSGAMMAVNCDSVDSLPPVTFSAFGLSFSLTGRDYIIKSLEDGKIVCHSVFVPGEEIDDWKLGLPFLTKYYTIFNYEQSSIAFAELF